MSINSQTRIWKYILHPQNIQTDRSIALTIPKGSKLLSVQNQRDNITMWFMVDKDQQEDEQRRFYVIETGGPIPEGIGKYLATVLIWGGNYVLHVFEG